VTALYDCEPDQSDELGFKEGDRIVVTKKLSRDWWVSEGHFVQQPAFD
jgi:3-hydroxymyristoyl/3-hydroxydecanoyl-(acyl carrier protein) dehydratase